MPESPSNQSVSCTIQRTIRTFQEMQTDGTSQTTLRREGKSC